MKTKTFDAYFDPGHGWLKVEKSLLKELNIENKITPYSYMRGNYAYLEEDCDASLLLETMRKNGYDVKTRYHSTDRLSKIRGYDSYLSPMEI